MNCGCTETCAVLLSLPCSLTFRFFPFIPVYVRVSHVYDWIIETSCKLFPTDVPEYMNCAAVYGFTDAPSDSPTDATTSGPSSAPSNVATPLPPSSSPSVATQQPSIQPTNAAADALLLECEGSCDTSDDCATGLSCFHRNSSAVALTVPGCNELSMLYASINLCYNATTVSDMIDASLFKSAAANQSAP